MNKRCYLNSLLIAFVLIATGCNFSHRAKIKGKIEGNKPDKLYLTEYNLTHEKIIDSIEISSDGTFTTSVKLQQPQLYRLYLNSGNYIWLLLSPKEKAQLNITIKKDSIVYRVDGSPFSQQVKMLNDTLQHTRKLLNQIEAQYIFALIKNDNNLQNLEKQYQQVIDRQRKFSIGFIIQHLNSPASIVALYQQLNDSVYVFHKPTDLQYVKILADTLSKYYPQSNIVRILCSERNRLMEQYEQLKKQSKILALRQADVKSFPEIRLPGISDDTITLSSAMDKLLLLTFWTPTDPDCRIAMNTFAKLYQKYHSRGFQLYNVALFDDAGYWKNMVKKLNLPGIHVIEQQGDNAASVRVYNVKQLPATVLLSKDGILAVNIFGDRLEDEIRKHLPQ